MKLLQVIARFILRVWGWKLVDVPHRPDKAVVIAYPHTSNWDFPITLLALAALPYHACWVGKDTMFKGIWGPILRALGGVEVNRRERTGFVERVANEFASRERFNLVIAVEGTRNRQEGWKSGFYRIAVAANVPVLLGCVDYAKREVGLLAVVELTGDEEADVAAMAAFYAGRVGPQPQQSLAHPIFAIAGTLS